MKTLVIILSAIGLLSLTSCNQKTDPTAMIENIETRTELLNTITSNHNYMTEFMDNMQGNNHAMQMMMKDSMMIKNMMQGMMKDGAMMGTMMQMMHKKGIMSEDCMQSCMKMMGEKGMDMQNMDTSTKDEHIKHH